MSKPIVEIKNISKKYQLGESFGYGNLREEFVNSVKGIFKSKPEEDENTLWALKDVSFEVNEGDVVGIIGRNGAGKSTLLKILSRITEPTSGEIKLRGRVASLLEVGTGFHPELTGRENVFFNGALLGMTKYEIKAKFDEIVAFAEIDKFIDTPVKRYSSGMYVRLAFAVAAHLEPEILVVDEVLAVGDLTFQKKCLGKMEDVSKQGRTVLFVSHNMEAVERLCKRAVLLNQGAVVSDNEVKKVIDFYFESNLNHSTSVPLKDRRDRVGEGGLRFTDFYFEDKNENKIKTLKSGEELNMVIDYECLNEKDGEFIVAVGIKSMTGTLITDMSNIFSGHLWNEIPMNGRIRCKLPKLGLNSGYFTFSIIARVNGVIEDFVNEVDLFFVSQGDFFETSLKQANVSGEVLFEQEWNIEKTV